MHHSLWDSLPVKVGHLVEVHKVLEQDWTPWSSCHGVQLVIHWLTMAGCQDIRSLGVGAHQLCVCVCGGLKCVCRVCKMSYCVSTGVTCRQLTRHYMLVLEGNYVYAQNAMAQRFDRSLNKNVLNVDL